MAIYRLDINKLLSAILSLALFSGIRGFSPKNDDNSAVTRTGQRQQAPKDIWTINSIDDLLQEHHQEQLKSAQKEDLGAYISRVYNVETGVIQSDSSQPPDDNNHKADIYRYMSLRYSHHRLRGGHALAWLGPAPTCAQLNVDLHNHRKSPLALYLKNNPKTTSSLLQRGYQSTVHRVQIDGRACVVKRFAGLAGKRAMRREVPTLLGLDHPSIIRPVCYEAMVEDVGYLVLPEWQPNIQPVLSMRCLAKNSKLLVETLVYLHQKKHIHGDLKQENIVFYNEQPQETATPCMTPILIDFGYAQSVDEPEWTLLNDSGKESGPLLDPREYDWITLGHTLYFQALSHYRLDKKKIANEVDIAQFPQSFQIFLDLLMETEPDYSSDDGSKNYIELLLNSNFIDKGYDLDCSVDWMVTCIVALFIGLPLLFLLRGQRHHWEPL